MMDEDDRLLSQEQAGAILRASARKLQTLREKGGGPPFVKVGRNVLYSERQLLAWLKANLTTGGVNGTDR